MDSTKHSLFTRVVLEEFKQATEKGLAMGEPTPKWFISFHADAYQADHLKPDEWETNCSEAKLDAFILDKIATRLGVEVSRVTFESPNSETVMLDGKQIGIVLCW